MHIPLKTNWGAECNRQHASSPLPLCLYLSCPCCLLEAVAELSHRATLSVYCSDWGKLQQNVSKLKLIEQLGVGAEFSFHLGQAPIQMWERPGLSPFKIYSTPRTKTRAPALLSGPTHLSSTFSWTKYTQSQHLLLQRKTKFLHWHSADWGLSRDATASRHL